MSKIFKTFALLAYLNQLAFSSTLLDEHLAPIKDFAPPALISPKDDIEIENQYDHSDRKYLFTLANSERKNYNYDFLLLANSVANSLSIKQKEPHFYTLAKLQQINANHYKSAAGQRVDFGYSRLSAAAVLGYTPDEFKDFRLSVLADELRNDHQLHFVMDPVRTSRQVAKFDANIASASNDSKLHFGAKFIQLKRQANNYKLRTAPKQMRMQINRQIAAIFADYEMDFGALSSKISLEQEFSKHLAKRFALGQIELLNAYKFPDIRSQITNIKFENTYQIDDNFALDFGIGAVHERAESKLANAMLKNPQPDATPPVFPNANMLWQKYHHSTFSKQNKSYLQAALGLSYQSDELKASAHFKHLVRLASNPERFSAVFAPMPQMAQISNPFIKPEKHNMLVLRLESKQPYSPTALVFEPQFAYGAELIADRVNDLIIYKRASDLAVISDNVNANLLSASVFAKARFARHYAAGIDINYHYAHNISEHKKLYQTPPAELNAHFGYFDYASWGQYALSAHYRYVLKARAADFIDSPTAGFGVLDLGFETSLKNHLVISAGVNNVLNKSYQEFITPDHVEAFAPQRKIAAPGRMIYLRLSANFD